MRAIVGLEVPPAVVTTLKVTTSADREAQGAHTRVRVPRRSRVPLRGDLHRFCDKTSRLCNAEGRWGARVLSPSSVSGRPADICLGRDKARCLTRAPHPLLFPESVASIA